ncbi:MAG: hypothetical protein EP298_13340 [Gammaproteobacteria bacterium]|nr:MAG: hypothetical protein EP298_13340 [Gammaproteobacteria bacterium]UTW41737.1 hypothetical protein KFE69_09495 [bacterium SCSIO 12844]
MPKYISQSNFFTSYSGNRYDKKQKKILVNRGIDLKNQLANGNHAILSKLNDIAIRIQKRINKGTLNQASISRYKQELKDLDVMNRKKVNRYIKICMVLSKHYSGDGSKVNWFFITNKTGSLAHMIDSNKYAIEDSGQNILSKILPSQEVSLKFPYSSGNSIKEKMKKGDQEAHEVIKSEETKRVVHQVSKGLVEFIKINFNQGQKRTLFNKFKKLNVSKKGAYPSVNLNELGIKSMKSLLSYLENDDESNYVAKLSMIWMVATGFSGGNIDKINNIYSHVIHGTKAYKDNKQKHQSAQVSLDRIGNSGTIEDKDIFEEDIFIPWKRDVDYRKVSASSNNPFVVKCRDEKLPYIAGVSGMANMYCKVMDVLNISPHSEQGKAFMEAAASFIVASSMHSYIEVNKSFNLYINRCYKADSVLPFLKIQSDQLNDQSQEIAM